MVVRIGKPCKLGDRYSPDQYAAEIECFDKRLAVELQFCADRLLSLQQGKEFLRSDITPLDLSSKILACIVDPSLRLLSPPYAIIYSDRSDARNRALLDEGTYVLNSLLQSAIQSHGRSRVEKRSDRANHTGDTVLGKRRVPVKILFVFPLYQRNVQLAVVGRFEVQRIDPEIVPSVHNAVERLVIRKVKRCFRDKEEERYRAFPLVVGA